MFRIATIIVAVSLLALSAPVVDAGSVSGKVTYADAPPKLKPVNMSADPDCASKHSGPVQSEVLVLGSGGTMANVVVSVKSGLPKKTYPVPTEPVVIDQRGCVYTPRVVGMMAGQSIKFLNSDGILHNVHALSKINPEFNIGMPPALKQKVKKIAKVEPSFAIKCDVHPWMRSYAVVLDHPFFAVTAPDGAFKIDNLPAGTYEIEAWHERLGSQTASVKVGDGAASVDFSFKKPTKK